MTWLSSSGRGVSFGGFSGEHAASEKSAEVLNDPMGIWGADFDQIPVSIIFDVNSPYRVFRFVGNATQARHGHVVTCVFPSLPPVYTCLLSFYLLVFALYIARGLRKFAVLIFYTSKYQVVAFLQKVEKRQLWVRPIEWLKLNFASCVILQDTFVGRAYSIFHLYGVCELNLRYGC